MSDVNAKKPKSWIKPVKARAANMAFTSMNAINWCAITLKVLEAK